MSEKTVKDIIKEAMQKPKAVAADGESVSQFQLSELIEAANAISRMGKKPGKSLRIMKPNGNSAV